MTLRELLEEKLRRRRVEQPEPTKPLTPKTTAWSGPSSEAPAEAWLAERSVPFERLEPGEIANVLEGLTPSGKDKRGRKVSFVEKGSPWGSQGPRSIGDWRPSRISK